MGKVIRIGTRDSQLAVWQATSVQQLLSGNNITSELVFIKSEGDLNLQTPLYEMGVQGIFTRSLDISLLQNNIDIAVHSMKDVPTRLAKGIVQAAVLERASYKDILVYKGEKEFVNAQLSIFSGTPLTTIPFLANQSVFTIATSSIRRKAQWLNRYPDHVIENLRGNINTRLRKVANENWDGAIFAAAGLERINLRPANSIELDWMLPAPAQGAIMVVCREHDDYCAEACARFNHIATAECTKIERDFLNELAGGCSTPVSALAQVINGKIIFKGNILSVDGKEKVEIEKIAEPGDSANIGREAAVELLINEGQKIADGIRNTAR